MTEWTYAATWSDPAEIVRDAVHAALRSECTALEAENATLRKTLAQWKQQAQSIVDEAGGSDVAADALSEAIEGWQVPQ